MKRALLLVGFIGCTGTVGDGPGDPGPNGDGTTTGDSTTGDAGAGDATGDPGMGGDPLPGDPLSGDPSTGGDPVSGGDPHVAQPQSCAERSAAIAAATGNTIDVSSGSFGQVLVGGSPTTLRQVVAGASSGDTILLADGTYTFEEAAPGNYTGIYFTTANLTMRSASGNASAVILDSNYAVHGGMSALITIAASGTVIADLTVQRSISHLVHFQSAGDNGVVHNVHLIDGGQQFIKASGTDIDNGEVSCSRFVMTTTGRDNVWGYGATDGGTRCYTGGIDTHDSRDWHVHDNYFEGIYCNAGGVGRPVHGKDPEDIRSGTTYTGGLSEHAIHMWDAVDGHGHIIERNQIVNCARGIGIGLQAEVHDTIVRNNTIFSEFAGDTLGEHDVGIILERAHDSVVLNNTVFFSHADAYANAIEYRWGSTSNLEVRNNLTNPRIHHRDGAEAGTTESNNVENAQAGWFENAAAGELHLSSCGVTEVVGQGVVHGSVTDDIDLELRSGTNDVGADQCQ